MIKFIIFIVLNIYTMNHVYSHSPEANVTSSKGVSIKPFVDGDDYIMEIEKILIINEYKILINENGICKRLNKNIYRKTVDCEPTLLPEFDNGKGYKTVSIKRKKFYIHRLVAAAFIPNPENKPEINHIDGNKANNHVSNLEWVNSSENQKHSVKIGTHGTMGEKTALLTEEQVRSIVSDNRKQRVIAKEYNVSFKNINNIKRGYTWSHLTGIIYKPNKR